MPVKILTPQQRRQYGRFAPTISPEQIAKHCYLTPNEINRVVARRPQAWQQMGYAIQLMTVRFLGTFLELKEALKVPKILMGFAAQQLHLHEIGVRGIKERKIGSCYVKRGRKAGQK